MVFLRFKMILRVWAVAVSFLILYGKSSSCSIRRVAQSRSDTHKSRLLGLMFEKVLLQLASNHRGGTFSSREPAPWHRYFFFQASAAGQSLLIFFIGHAWATPLCNRRPATSSKLPLRLSPPKRRCTNSRPQSNLRADPPDADVRCPILDMKNVMI